MGLVLNRPSETLVDDAVPDLAPLADPEDVVHVGGPVGPESVIVLGVFEDPGGGGLDRLDDLGVVNPERPTPGRCGRCASTRATPAGRPASSTASWSTRHGSSRTPSPTTRSTEGDLWSTVLDRKGGGYTLLARMPEDPSLN